VGQLRNRIRVIVARVRAGEGAHVIADLAETTEHWLKSDSLPRPLRPPAERIGTAVGDLGRAYRPPPSDMPPPDESMQAEEATPRTARAHEAARSNGHSAAKARKPRVKPSEPEAPKPRASARRSPTKKRAATSAPAAPEPKPQRKTNGKGRPKRPSARRTSGDKTPKPT
jgi:hypothetical protein